MSTTLADALTVPPDSGRGSKISLIILSLSSFGGYPDLSGRVRGAKCMSELISAALRLPPDGRQFFASHSSLPVAFLMVFGTSQAGPRAFFSVSLRVRWLRVAFDGLQIIGSLASQLDVAFGILLIIFVLNFGEVERDRVNRDFLPHGASRLERGDQDIRELDLQVFLLLLSGLTASEEGVRDVFAVGAGEQQLRARFAIPHREREVIHGDLATATASAKGHGSAIRFAPRPAQQVNLVLVFVSLTFAVNTLYLQEIINCHESYASCEFKC